MPETIQQIRSTASLIVPEILLLATACAMFFVGPFLVSHEGESAPGLRHRWGFVSLIALCAAGIVWFRSGTATVEGTLFQIDHLVWVTRGLSLSAGMLLVLVMWNQIDDNHSAEAYACLLAMLAGTSLVAAAHDLVSLFLSLEMVSIPTYVILYLPRRDRNNGEASAQVLFVERILIGARVVWNGVAIWRGRHDELRGHPGRAFEPPTCR